MPDESRLHECPLCGSDDVRFLNPAQPTRLYGPGELGIFWCGDCLQEFKAFEPEPPDGYEGDGVFASNH